jgi:hypothetical protein
MNDVKELVEKEHYEEAPATILPWSFTIKALGPMEKATIELYAKLVDKWRYYGHIKDYSFEQDSRGKLHMHGIIMLKRHFHRKRLMHEGFHIKLVEIYDETGWINYIHKEPASPPEQRVNNEEYMF